MLSQELFGEANPDYDKLAAKKYRIRNKEAVRLTKVKTTYGLSKEDYLALLENQNNLCAICKTDTPGGRGNWHVDHDHITGKVRGLLCHKCNVALGGFKDSVQLLNAAITYLLGV